MRPVDDATDWIIFVFAAYLDRLAAPQREGAGEIGVGFYADHEIAIRGKPQQKPFVRAFAPGTYSEIASDGALSGDFDVRSRTGKGLAYGRVVGRGRAIRRATGQ
jgi:hypothetical protein